MAEMSAGRSDLQLRLDDAAPGDRIVLKRGRYDRVLHLKGRRGTPTQPIVIEGEPGAVMTMGVSAEEFRRQGNQMAADVEATGEIPGLYPWIEQGRLILEDCAHVTIRGLAFQLSWPTHLFLHECQDVTIQDCDFEDGTFAIGATGRSTHGITIERCTWLQDRVPGRIWREIPWWRIHGAWDEEPARYVDIDADWRLFDGDFFRARDIQGGVTIRHCRIGQAFNAIHLFNEVDDFDLNRDVHVHDCLFFEIRDNVLEPETSARNWWFHHNRIVNGHKWFSLDLTRQEHFYFFANLMWLTSSQGPPVRDDFRGGACFKVPKSVNPPLGPAWVFHNSIVLRGSYIKNGIFAGLRHRNNAILCLPEAGDDNDQSAPFFGELDTPAHPPKYRFTPDWKLWGISMAHDVVGHPQWPGTLRDHGYGIDRSALGADPMFLEPKSAGLGGKGLRLHADSPCRDAAGALDVALPDGERWRLPAGRDVGAWQGEALLKGPAFQAMTIPTG